MGTVLAVCRSSVRGIQKTNEQSGWFETEWGIRGDAHAGRWHRQVSLLSADRIARFNEKGAGVGPGDFGENLVVEGIDFSSLPVGTGCAAGTCCWKSRRLEGMPQPLRHLPQNGRLHYAQRGSFRPGAGSRADLIGDQMSVVPRKELLPFQAAVITLSDRCSSGEREDESGPAIEKRLIEEGYQIIERLVLPDDRRPWKKS